MNSLDNFYFVSYISNRLAILVASLREKQVSRQIFILATRSCALLFIPLLTSLLTN